MSNIKIFTYTLGIITLFIIYSSFFTVDQTKQAIVLQFGEPKRVINKPGLNFKIPFIQDVTYFEKRVLSLVSSDSDVRIRRADYPEATSQNIFNRMRSEREQEAKEFRAQGAEEAQKIRSDAEKQKTILLAEAKRESESIRGNGDGEAIKIYADAFGKDAKFFKFYRSMLAYEITFVDKDTTMILSPESEFFDFFSDKKGN